MGNPLDFNEPLATLLRTATADVHERAEHSQGAGWLTRGELDKDEYVRFLMMLYHVYDALERALEKHSSHPVLAPTYNPTLLARAPGLSSDIAYLLDVPEASWRSHPLHVALQFAPPPELTAYVSRIDYLANDAEDPSPLLAHAYVRYLGDLSGGQVIRRRVARAYGLERDDGLGTMFYDFKKLGSNESASVGDMRKVKEWFRDGMNAGAGNNGAVKERIVKEAIKVFELNEGLFTTLRPPSNIKSDTESANSPLLQHPNSSTELPKSVSERRFPVQSVLTFILAASLAHFILVVGGFTGQKGYSKLVAVQDWLAETLSSS